MEQQQKAFTLIELIVVITILAILWTIAFISLQWFSKDARNSSRASDLKSIEKVLFLYQIRENKFPTPTNPVNITYSGWTVWTQWSFWEDSRKSIGSRSQISNVPTDPLATNQYTYSVLNTGNEFQLAGVFEWELLLNNLNSTYAALVHWTTKITWNYNWQVAKTSAWWKIYVLAVPSIISSDISLTKVIDILDARKLMYNWFHNLPASYSWTTVFNNPEITWNIINTWSLLVYSSSSLDWLSNESEQQILIDNLQAAYSWTLVSSEPKIETIINSEANWNELYVAQVIIKNNLESSIVISSSDIWILNCSINQSPTVEVTFYDWYKDDISLYWAWFYIQSNTCLKWGTQVSSTTLRLSKKKAFTEPTWDWTNYIRTYDTTSEGWDIIWTIILWTDIDYPAFSYCISQGSGWRLPTRRELSSIITDAIPSWMTHYTALPSILQDEYWSSTFYAGHPDKAWQVGFNIAHMWYFTEEDAEYILCVHD